MTDFRALMQLHVAALFTHSADADLLCVNEPNGARAPRFFLGHTPSGVVLRFRDDLDGDVRRELETAAAMDSLGQAAHILEPTVARYVSILARVAPVQKIWTGPAFCFPTPAVAHDGGAVRITEANADVLQAHFQGWTTDVPVCQPMFALVVDHHAVSLCCSVRRTQDAHEAGVETIPAFRGRGYAPRVVAAWARAVHDEGPLPLYSTSSTNDGSRAVARTLGLTQFGHDLHIA